MTHSLAIRKRGHAAKPTTVSCKAWIITCMLSDLFGLRKWYKIHKARRDEDYSCRHDSNEYQEAQCVRLQESHIEGCVHSAR